MSLASLASLASYIMVKVAEYYPDSDITVWVDNLPEIKVEIDHGEGYFVLERDIAIDEWYLFRFDRGPFTLTIPLYKEPDKGYEDERFTDEDRKIIWDAATDQAADMSAKEIAESYILNEWSFIECLLPLCPIDIEEASNMMKALHTDSCILIPEFAEFLHRFKLITPDCRLTKLGEQFVTENYP